MCTSRLIGLTALGVLSAIAIAGCHSDAQSAQTLDQERIAVRGSKPPADAGAKYLAAQGGGPGAVQAKINSAGAAFQNRKK